MNRREFFATLGSVVAASVTAMGITEDKVTYPVSQPVTPEILEHFSDPNRGDVLTVISDGKEWHIV